MLKQIIDSYANTLNKQFHHDRTKTVGASEIGQCARKTYWVKHEGTYKGAKRDIDWFDRYGARVRGTVIEEAFWQPALRAKFGDKLLVSGKEQKTLQSGYLSATPDALIVNLPSDCLKDLGVADIGSDCLMAECKSIDPRTNLVEAKTENLFQCEAQLGLVRELTPYKPNYDLLTYVDASFWSEIIEYPVEYDPDIYYAAKDRATVIMTAEAATDLPPEGWIAGGKECSFCPFVGACGVERRSIPKDNKAATPQFVAEITDYCDQHNQLKANITAEEKRLRTVQQTIKDRLREKGVRRIEGVVNWFEVKGAVRYGPNKMKARLEELDEDVEQFASVDDPSDRLVIAAIPVATSGNSQMPDALKRKTKTVKRKTGKTKTGKRK
jgi:hypothetical protein